ncbi:hypothetical protein [Streptomyces sp. B22F1]|uniref:hypothetical protein n=1 Tax=Streptomyces sp. B22F1 TaxID=3153566 RepID=UPI00325E0913
MVTVHHTPSDPARIGGHRLLARLGAGGMGVVYLGRAETGELAAVKVIRPEYAAETDFRARFRREAAAARRVRSPWVVPVTGADPEAEAPWLATAFVPGPALDDAGVPEPAANTMDTLCVTRAPEELLAAPFLRYLTDDRPVRRTAVVRDEGREAADFSLALGENPPNDGIVTVHDTDDGIAAAVEAAVARDAEAVIYAGVSPERAAQCARAMAAADFAGPRGGTWRTMTPAFLKAAGITAGGWLCAAPFSDPAAPRDFAAAYRAAYGAAPPRWAPEAYDAVGLIAAAIARQKRTATDGTVDRGALAQELFRETYRGVAKELTFARDDTHQLEPGGSLFLYQARGDTFASLGPYA